MLFWPLLKSLYKIRVFLGLPDFLTRLSSAFGQLRAAAAQVVVSEYTIGRYGSLSCA